MAGLKELIMTLYDCPPYLDSNTNNKGLLVIRDAALSILGAATPAELATIYLGRLKFRTFLECKLPRCRYDPQNRQHFDVPLTGG
jgi:hypothetical protein